MAFIQADRVKTTSTTTGTGAYTVGSAEAGFQSLGDVMANSDTGEFFVTDGTDWETFFGTYTTSGTTLARTTMYASSNAGAAVNWGAGTKTIGMCAPARYNAEGTAFPSSPRTSQRFFRTDLGLNCYYDGTRWLTVTLFRADMSFQHALPPTGTSGVQIAYATLDDTQSGIWIEKLLATTYVATNDSSNYWTVQGASLNANGTNTNIGSTFNTQVDTQAVYVKHNVTIGAAVAATQKGFTAVITKTGTPASMYLYAAFLYRLIVT